MLEQEKGEEKPSAHLKTANFTKLSALMELKVIFD